MCLSYKKMLSEIKTNNYLSLINISIYTQQSLNIIYYIKIKIIQ